MPEIKTQMRVLNALDHPLSRELMVSNLLLNSYGKALRLVNEKLSKYCEKSQQMKSLLKQFDVECSTEGLWMRTPYTLGATDFEDLLFEENVRFTFRVSLLFLSLLVNAYTVSLKK